MNCTNSSICWLECAKSPAQMQNQLKCRTNRKFCLSLQPEAGQNIKLVRLCNHLEHVEHALVSVLSVLLLHDVEPHFWVVCRGARTASLALALCLVHERHLQ